jgi:hypothetical protein
MSPVTLATSGICGSEMLSRSSTLRSGLLAGATILVWKAWLTGMRMAWKPLASQKRSMACSTALLAPPTTHWL